MFMLVIHLFIHLFIHHVFSDNPDCGRSFASSAGYDHAVKDFVLRNNGSIFLIKVGFWFSFVMICNFRRKLGNYV